MSFLESLFRKSIVNKFGVAIFDQAFISAVNFSVGVLLIRRIPAHEYGLFVLLNGIILLAIGIQNAVITTPMTVLGPKLQAPEKKQFVSALANTQYFIWLPAGLIFGLLTAIGKFINLSQASTQYLSALVIVILVVFSREFMRRVFFVYMRPVFVLIVDVVYGIIFLLTIYFVTLEGPTSALDAIGSMGAAALLAGGIGILVFQKSVGWKASISFAPIVNCWKHGRWAVMGVIVTWLQSQGALYLLGGLEGTVDVADVSASRLLLMPVIVVLTGVISIIKPYGASILAEGREKPMMKLFYKIMAVLALFALGYSIVIIAVKDYAALFLFKKEIPGMALLLSLWGLVFLSQIFRRNLSTVLQIFERFETLFYIGTFSAVFSLIASYLAILQFKGPGSIMGLIFGELVYIAGIYWFFQRKKRKSPEAVQP